MRLMVSDGLGPFQPRQRCDSGPWEHRALPNFLRAPALGTGLGLEEEESGAAATSTGEDSTSEMKIRICPMCQCLI